MKQRIRNGLSALMIALMAALVPAAPVFAAPGCPGGDTAKGQVLQGVGETGNQCDGAGVTNTVKTIVEILSYVAGIVAVIMIIVAGFKYITSNGEASKVGSAKNTLIYAMVGLVVVALSQFLVHFVLGGILK